MRSKLCGHKLRKLKHRRTYNRIDVRFERRMRRKYGKIAHDNQ